MTLALQSATATNPVFERFGSAFISNARPTCITFGGWYTWPHPFPKYGFGDAYRIRSMCVRADFFCASLDTAGEVFHLTHLGDSLRFAPDSVGDIPPDAEPYVSCCWDFADGAWGIGDEGELTVEQLEAALFEFWTLTSGDDENRRKGPRKKRVGHLDQTTLPLPAACDVRQVVEGVQFLTAVQQHYYHRQNKTTKAVMELSNVWIEATIWPQPRGLYVAP